MTLTTILFDLDDTLVVDTAAVDAALLATCSVAQHRYGLDPQTLAQRVRQRARQLWQAAPTITYCRAIGISSAEGLWSQFLGDEPHLQALHRWAPTYRREAWSQALADHGVTDGRLAEHLAAVFPRQRRARHALFADVELALQELRPHYQLALITNGAPDLQREKIRGAGLASYFETVVVSGEVGVGKPDPRLFACALTACQVAPGEAVMVGNDLARDILGARNANVKGIWVNREKAHRDDAIVIPDAEIADLGQLQAVCTGINP